MAGKNSFRAITFFPDGMVYDSNIWDVDELAALCPYEISRFLTLDSRRRRNFIGSPIGELEFVWSASHIFGVSTLLKGGVTVNAGVFLPGVDRSEEDELLRFYLKNWRDIDLVKSLSSEKVPFLEAEEIQQRPLVISVNWATISKEDYNKIAYYDLFIAGKYFQVPRSPSGGTDGVDPVNDSV